METRLSVNSPRHCRLTKKKLIFCFEWTSVQLVTCKWRFEWWHLLAILVSYGKRVLSGRRFLSLGAVGWQTFLAKKFLPLCKHTHKHTSTFSTYTWTLLHLTCEKIIKFAISCRNRGWSAHSSVHIDIVHTLDVPDFGKDFSNKGQK